jgi:AcrR family transcriptional regulator
MEVAQANQRRLQGAKTREECLAAATAVFARRGYQRATMDEIAAAARVTKGALYWHYRTKEEFLVAVLRKLNSDWESDVVSHFEPGGSADELLLRTFDRIVDLNLRAPWVNRFFLTVALDGENIHSEVESIMREIVGKNRWLFSALVEYGRERGDFRRDVDAAEGGAALAAGYTGALASWYLDPTGTDLRGLVQAFARSILTGFRNRDGKRHAARKVIARPRGRRRQ